MRHTAGPRAVACQCPFFNVQVELCVNVSESTATRNSVLLFTELIHYHIGNCTQVTRDKRAKKAENEARLRSMERQSTIMCVFVAVVCGPCFKLKARMFAKRKSKRDARGPRMTAEEALALFDKATTEGDNTSRTGTTRTRLGRRPG